MNDFLFLLVSCRECYGITKQGEASSVLPSARELLYGGHYDSLNTIKYNYFSITIHYDTLTIRYELNP
jgi:hypothetical protein